jgi:hypothetical protein
MGKETLSSRSVWDVVALCGMLWLSVGCGDLVLDVVAQCGMW